MQRPSAKKSDDHCDEDSPTMRRKGLGKFCAGGRGAGAVRVLGVCGPRAQNEGRNSAAAAAPVAAPSLAARMGVRMRMDQNGALWDDDEDAGDVSAFIIYSRRDQIT